MEKQPDKVVYLELNDEIFELRPRNTDVYRFIARYAIYNHIYHTPDDEEETFVYLFEFKEKIHELADLLISKEYPTHLNIPEPLVSDKKILEEVLLDELKYDIEDFEENGME